jgi:hypothetical protein
MSIAERHRQLSGLAPDAVQVEIPILSTLFAVESYEHIKLEIRNALLWVGPRQTSCGCLIIIFAWVTSVDSSVCCVGVA